MYRQIRVHRLLKELADPPLLRRSQELTLGAAAGAKKVLVPRDAHHSTCILVADPHMDVAVVAKIDALPRPDKRICRVAGSRNVQAAGTGRLGTLPKLDSDGARLSFTAIRILDDQVATAVAGKALTPVLLGWLEEKLP